MKKIWNYINMLDQKNSKWSIKQICLFDISLIQKEISNYTYEWDLDLTRQKEFKTHKDTKMYQLQYMDYAWKEGTSPKTETVNSLKSDGAKNQLLEIYNKLEEIYESRVVRVELIKMNANSRIAKHTDASSMLYIARRIHIPIITNQHVYFTVHDNTINMQEGIAYEINNYLAHEVINDGEQDRVHLIIDLFPESYFHD